MLRANLSARRGPGPCPRRAAPPCPAAAPQRARHVAGASAPAAPGAGAGGDAGQPVMLNNWHTLWLQGAGAARPVLFGGDYVLLPSEQAPASAPPRGAAGAGPAPGLVPWRRPGGLSVVPPAIPNAGLVSAARLAAAGLVVVPAGETGIVPYGGAPVALQGCGYIEAEAVDAEVLPPVPPADADLPPTTTAIVPRPRAACDLGDLGDLEAPDPDQEVVYESDNTFSPRRGHKIKFTCRRCGGVNIKPVNIHAWREGTVFARCGKCHVTHKLIDNLKLFHEMSGPVFETPAPPLDPSAPLPPGLPRPAPGGGGVGGYDGFRDWRPRGGEPADGA